MSVYEAHLVMMSAESHPAASALARRRSLFRRCEGLGCVIGLSGAIIVFVAAVYGLGSTNDVFHSYDFREISTYHKAYYRAALLSGRVPLWTPYTFSGWPFAANPLTQTFYPPSLLVLALPQPSAVIVDLIAHLVAAALGFCLFLRLAYGLGLAASAFGALVYALSGSFVGHAYAGHPHYYAACTYIPFLLLAVNRSIVRLSSPASVEAWAGRGWANPFQIARAAGRWLWIGSGVLGLQLLSGGIPFVWLTLLFAGSYWLGEALTCGARSWRAWWQELVVLALMILGGLGIAAVQLLPAAELSALSNRMHTDYKYAITGSFPPALLRHLVLARAPIENDSSFWEYYGYVGLGPLLLAFLSLGRLRTDRRVMVLAVLAVVTGLFMVGGHGFLFPLLWSYVPGFTLFRNPARTLVVLDFILATLAAIQLHVITRGLALRPRAGILIGAVTGLLGLATLVDVSVCARGNARRLFISDDRLLERPLHMQLAAVFQNDRSWYRFWLPRRVFRENHGYAVDARNIGGYDTMYLERYSRFIHYMTDTAVVPSLVTILTQRTFANAPSPFPFKILGVKYAAHKDTVAQLDSSRIRRAWFVTRARRVGDEAEALAYMRGDLFAPYGEVIFESAEAERLKLPAANDHAQEPPPPPEVSVVVEERSPEYLHVMLGPHPDGYLVLSEIFYPGWRATVAGRDVPIYRADSVLRCIKVSATDSEIDMVFAPASVRYGACVTGATLCCVLVGWWRALRHANPK